MLSDGFEDQIPNAAGWLEKYQINLDADILVTKDRGERSAKAWNHDLKDLQFRIIRNSTNQAK